MILKPNNPKIRYTGRWNICDNRAISTANGSWFEFAYKGECAVIGFDVSHASVPFPHIYISVDGGANIEVSLDRFIRISAERGEHKVCVIMKGSVESQNRWYTPITAAVCLAEIEAENFLELPVDKRPLIEFIGDSITEGISIDVGYHNYGDTRDMVYWDDATAGYAWLTAKKLNFRPVFMGYGFLSLTHEGAGYVPPVGESYGYYSKGYPMESANADYIVINHGTNDRGAEKEIFKQKYFEFLGYVRQRNSKSKIISLTPFSGCLSEEIKEVVDMYNCHNGDDIFYIDTTGWIEPQPLHPTRQGHIIVAEELVKKFKEKFGDKLNSFN